MSFSSSSDLRRHVLTEEACEIIGYTWKNKRLLWQALTHPSACKPEEAPLAAYQVCMCVCVYVYVSVYVCMYVYVFVLSSPSLFRPLALKCVFVYVCLCVCFVRDGACHCNTNRCENIHAGAVAIILSCANCTKWIFAHLLTPVIH